MKKTLLFSLAAGALIAGATAATQIATRSGDVQQIDVTLDPASGSTLPSISEITIQLPYSDNLYMEPNVSRIGDIILTNDDTETVIKASEWGEPSQSTDGSYYEYPVKFATPITEEGTYTLSIPQGVIREMETVDGDSEPKLGGAQNKAATATYTIEKTPDPEPTLVEIAGYLPAAGSAVTSLSEIDILMEAGEIMYSYDISKLGDVTLTLEGSTTPIKPIMDAELEGGMTDDEKYFKYPVKFETITEAGEYTLSIPEGFLCEMEYDEAEDKFVKKAGGAINEAATAKFTIEAEAPTQLDDYTLNPASGAKLEELKSIQIVFNKLNYNSALYNSDNEKEFIIMNEASGKIYYGNAQGDWSYEEEEGLALELFFYEDEAREGSAVTITEAGTWTLHCAPGVFNLKGDLSPDITAEYIIEGGEPAVNKFVTYTFAPTGAVGSLSAATLIFPEYTGMSYYVMVNDEAGEAEISNGEKTYKAEASLNDDNWDEREYKFTFLDENEETVVITEAGEWTLTIPAGYFTDSQNNTSSLAMEAKFTVDSSIVTEIKWTADPEEGSKVEVTGYAQNVTFTFDDATEVSYTPTDELAGLRITYNGEDLRAVENVFGDDAEYGYKLVDNYGDNTVVIRLSPKVLAAPGILNISIDEGRFTIDGMASPAIEYSCTFGDYKEFSYTLTPDGSEPVSSLAEFILTFTNATSATIDEDKLDITLSQGMAWSFPGYPTVTPVEGAEHPTFKIAFNFTAEALSVFKAGNYTLRIDEGSFILDAGQPSPMISQTYSYKSDKPVDWTLTKMPDSDDVILYNNEWDNYYFVEIGVAFAETESYSRGENFSAIKIELDGVALEISSTVSETTTYTSGFSSDSNVLYFDVRNTESFAGTLKLTIPAGAIKLTGEPNAEDIVYTWNVVAPKTYTYTLTPDGKTPVSSLDEITVAFPEAVTGELWNRGFIQFKDSNYNWLTLEDVVAVEGADCATFKMTFDTSEIKEGVYKLEIREECFTLDGSQASPAIEQAYTYKKGSGLTMIPAAADGTYTVYTLDGKVVLDKAAATDLLNLEKGIYIINGKKIAIK